MKTLLSLVALGLRTGCGLFSDYIRNDAKEQLERGGGERHARMKADGKLNPKELDVGSNRVGWVREDARGLPQALSTEELAQRLRSRSPKRRGLQLNALAAR